MTSAGWHTTPPGELGAAARLAQGQQGAVADHAAGRGRSAARSAARSAGPWLVNRVRMSSGPVRISARAWSASGSSATWKN